MFGLKVLLLLSFFSWQLTFRQFSTMGEPPEILQRLLGPPYARVGLTVGRLRPEGLYTGTWGRLRVAGELEVRWTSVPLDFPLGRRPASLRWRTLVWEDSTGSVDLRAELDRFEWSLHLSSLSFTLGRQPVSLGRSHLLGVMDVWSPFSPFALDTDFKPGTDILRGRLSLSDVLQAMVLVHDRQNALVTGSGDFSMGTVELAGGRIRNLPWWALAWEGTWRETAGWAEGTLLDGYGQVALGMEHHLPRTRLALEGMLQHPDPEQRPFVVRTWLQEGLRRLACHSCGMLYVEHRWHPLLRTALGGLISGDDGSTALMAQIFFDLSDSQDMILWAFSGFPDTPESPGTVGGTGRWFGIYARWSW